MSSSSFFFYSFAYFLLSTFIVCPSTETVSAGLTIRSVFANFLGSERESFIQYHIKRSIATILVHSLLPFGNCRAGMHVNSFLWLWASGGEVNNNIGVNVFLLGYVLGLILTGHIDAVQVILGDENPWLLVLMACALIGPLFALYKVLRWSKSNWSTHPIAESLAVYCNDNTSWLSVASDINTEFRGIDKFTIETSSIIKVVVTENWIIKVTPYKLHFAHQSDTALIVNKSDTHALSLNSRGGVQYLNAEVTPKRPGAKSFNIRFDALDLRDLQDKITRPIEVLDTVVFYRTLSDIFIDTFKEQVAKNREYETAQELDQCVGCTQATSNVKLNKLCTADGQTRSSCVACYCRPMWCDDCMAKWFASRQNETMPETWMSSKCTCPMCRAEFCMLDVSYVKSTFNNNS